MASVLSTTLNPSAKAIEKGFHFTKILTILAADFNKTLNEIAPDLFLPHEVFGGFMLCDATTGIFDVVIESFFRDPNTGQPFSMAFQVPSHAFIPLSGGLRILTGTDSACVTVFGGQ